WARVRRREAAGARPEALPGAGDLVAVAEQHRRLVGLVLELEEPLRGALLARYVEGMPPREIAARTGESVQTVKSRIARGPERLRERVDAGPDGAAGRGLAAAAPVGAVAGARAGPASEAGPAVMVRVVEQTAEKPISWATVVVRPMSGGEARGTTGTAGEPARVQVAPETGGVVWAWAEGFAVASVRRPQ